jgi:hypothetical protein
LLFAGEATHSSYFSTVHGAIETGWREAKRITQFRKQALNSAITIPSSVQICDSVFEVVKNETG